MNTKIPFRIGFQYDNWEDDLVITEDRFSNDLYCSYLWIGKEQKKFLSIKPLKTELIFYWERLEVVILEFKDHTKKLFEELNNLLSYRFSEFQSDKKNEHPNICKFKDKNVTFWNSYYEEDNTTMIVYFLNSFPLTNELWKNLH